ncbi:hypothetical protein A2229_05570 [Candidatus Peregrinibacteria bacterium RIFOXYA2_FULL_33_7]|nr:MAG: hypothetical protein A2229_05570 [Candidatus Peregrinibacteria bacterium RIFOXYA2_FULL_33_7]
MSGIKNFLKKIFPDNSVVRLTYHKILAVIAAIIWRFPSENMEVIAVTGTNGKTTTCNMIAAIMMEAGKKVGMATTVRFRIGDEVWSNRSKQTTLSPFQLQKLLRDMVYEHCDVAIIEATSHAMAQSRLWGINVDTAVLTNVDKDHIEYHGSFEEYRRAKGLLFDNLHKFKRKPHIKKVGILNRDDKNFEYFNKFFYDRVISYGFTAKADSTAANVNFSVNKSTFTLKVPNSTLDIILPLSGKFNIENALAAISTGIAHNISLNVIQKALAKMETVPGRLELIDEGQLFNIVVDYAHIPDAMQKVMEIFKPITKGSLIVVFGATGGGRDKGKRPEMGHIAENYCDKIILTNDDPYTEDQVQIIEDIANGMKRKEGEDFWKVTDRRQAIKLGLAMAKEEDTVLVLGKGGEEVIVIGEDKIPWDDRNVIRELLSREVKVEI